MPSRNAALAYLMPCRRQEIIAGEIDCDGEYLDDRHAECAIFGVGMVNKIYLDPATSHSVLLPPIAETDCECKMTAEYDCPESFRICTTMAGRRYPQWRIRWARARRQARSRPETQR